MNRADADALHARLTRRNPHLIYQVVRTPQLGEPTFYVRVSGRAEPAPRRPRRIGPEQAVLKRRHRELDEQLQLAA